MTMINQDGRHKEDCIYNDGLFCKKGLSGTLCDICGCVAFISKGEKMQLYHYLQMKEMEKHID